MAHRFFYVDFLALSSNLCAKRDKQFCMYMDSINNDNHTI